MINEVSPYRKLGNDYAADLDAIVAQADGSGKREYLKNASNGQRANTEIVLGFIGLPRVIFKNSSRQPDYN